MRTLIPTLLLLFSATAFGQEFKWATSLDAARAEAKERGVPLLISMHTSTEKACKRMLKTIYTDPEVQAKLAEFVVLPTCFDEHEENAARIDGQEMMVSTLFLTVGCDVLTQNEALVRAEFFSGPQVKVPQHLFIDATGKVFMKKIYELKKAKFLTLLDNALIAFGSKESETLDALTRAQLKAVRTGSNKEREAGVSSILDRDDERRTQVLYLTMRGIRKEKERAVAVRAMGKEEYSHASEMALKFLRDPSDWVRNCTVVTLEELRAAEAEKPLLELFKRARDKEIKKDILRALGPCASDSEEAKAILMKHAKSRKDKERVAAYLSLGHFLEHADVRELLQQRYKAEGKDTLMKTAIIWGYSKSRDADYIPDVQAFIGDSRNQQLIMVADAAMAIMKGGEPKSWWRLVKAIKPLYGRDKVMRNQVRVWNEWGKR